MSCSWRCFCSASIAALFGPIKYGILPDHLARAELPAGNALVEGATFIAILLGTIVGGLAAKDGGDPAHFAGADDRVLGRCAGSRACSSRAPARRAPDLAIDPNIVALDRGAAAASCATIRACGGARWSTSWFWLVGAVALSLLPPLVKNGARRQRGGGHRLLSPSSRSRSRSARALPPGSRAGRIVLLPTLIGAVLLGLFALDLGWSTIGVAARPTPCRSSRQFLRSARTMRVAIDLAGLAIAGGLFIVPAFAAVQAWAGADRRARVIAAVNVLNAAFMAARRADRRRAADARA